jgi:hypothetical protein
MRIGMLAGRPGLAGMPRHRSRPFRQRCTRRGAVFPTMRLRWGPGCHTRPPCPQDSLRRRGMLAASVPCSWRTTRRLRPGGFGACGIQVSDQNGAGEIWAQSKIEKAADLTGTQTSCRFSPVLPASSVTLPSATSASARQPTSGPYLACGRLACGRLAGIRSGYALRDLRP